MVGLLALRALDGARLCAIEVQPRLAELARRNLRENGFADRGEVVEADVAAAAFRRRIGGARFHLLLTNPPYQPLGRGAQNPDGEAAIARHEVRLPLARLVAEARRTLRPGGEAAFVYPAARLAELLGAAQAVGLSARKLRLVHPRRDRAATRALVLCDKSAPHAPLEVLPPLIEHDGVAPTAELRRICGD